MSREGQLAQWRDAFSRPVTGWDLTALGPGYSADETPWSYDGLARALLRDARSALDMGTGGGEVLSNLSEALPTDTVATEGWPPNIPVASATLAPLGIDVVGYDAETDARMPFPEGRFDVVLNRHEAYVATEVMRVLRPGGAFLTQQVDARDLDEVQRLFGHRGAYPHITLRALRVEAERAGFTVEQAEEWSGETRFADVTTFVRFLAYVPWEVPADFGIDRYAEQLLALRPPLAFTQRRFYLLGRKPS